MPFERKHRLPLDLYRGQIAAAFTACLRFSTDSCLDDEAHQIIAAKLADASEKYDADIAARCLMPDHLHVLLVGRSESADLWKAMTAFKQQTGFWFAGNRPDIEWQKDFFDHIIRSDESLETQVLYIVHNSVRAGLVDDWRDYPWTGGKLVESLHRQIAL